MFFKFPLEWLQRCLWQTVVSFITEKSDEIVLYILNIIFTFRLQTEMGDMLLMSYLFTRYKIRDVLHHMRTVT